MSKVTAKNLWGESFHVVPEGLDEDEVVKYVDELKVELDRHSALQKLAEQTVVEADKLAGSIKDQGRKDAEEEAARIRAAAEAEAARITSSAEEEATGVRSSAEEEATKARTSAQGEATKVRASAEEEAAKIKSSAERQAAQRIKRLLTQAERKAEEEAVSVVAKAMQEAEEVASEANRRAEEATESARASVPTIRAQAKLDAEYMVRKFTTQFVEEIRSVVTETTTSMVPTLNQMLQDSEGQGALEDGQEPAPQPAKGSSRSSKK